MKLMTETLLHAAATLWNTLYRVLLVLLATDLTGFCFSGHLSAACISLQIKLGRPLLWLACGKHIGEIILTHVWEALKVETSRSPDIEIFKRFQDKGFDATPYASADLHTIKVNKQQLDEFFISQSKKIELFLEFEQDSQVYTRGDYKELLD